MSASRPLGHWLASASGDVAPFSPENIFRTSGPFTPIALHGQTVGVRYSDAFADYALLFNVGPADPSASRTEQTASTFQTLNEALRIAGFAFQDVLRTWLYMDRILEWYDDFNRQRDAFFERLDLFGHWIPASTGIGCANPCGTAISAGALAVRPKTEGVARAMVESPLQCSALAYRSTFSRAVEWVTPEARTLYISGTASIAPEGQTLHVGDTAKQIALTMEVIEALLKSRDLTFADTSRAIAYIKDAKDLPLWDAWLAKHNLPQTFATPIVADICRSDLLFEVELDAVRPLR